jgi:hypothetical protein
MSYNDLIYRELEASLMIKKQLLEQYSKGNKNSIKQKILDLENYKSNLENKNEEVSAFSQLNIETFGLLKEQIDYSSKEIIVKEELLKEKINNYNSQIESKQLNVQGKLKELRSKLNLIFGKRSEERFLIQEDFLNFFNLNYSRTKKSNLSIDVDSEVATLPVAEERKVEVGKIFISNDSNCIPGNYSNGKNKYIYSIIDKNEDTVFEAFKEGEGPLVLELIFNFKREEIVNEFSIAQLNSRGSSNIEIENVYYSDINENSFNLKQLVNVDYQSFKILSSNRKNHLKIKHVPVKAAKAKVTLKVKEYSLVENLSVFFVGLKDIAFKSIKYKDEGEINSFAFNIPENYFEIFYKELSFPKRKLTFDTLLNVSIDNGGTFSKLIEGESLLTDGAEKQLVYKYSVKKNRNSILKINELLDDSYFVDIESESKLINKNISPSKFEIPFEGVLRNSLKVVQPKVLSRSESLSRRIKLGKIKNTGVESFTLESSLKEYEDNELSVFINKQLCKKVTAEEDLNEDLTWFLKNDKKTILVYTNKNQPILEVSLLIKPLLPVLIKKAEGYYIELKEKFDYDKNSLEISCITSLSSMKEENIPVGKDKVFLENSYIDKNSIQVEKYFESAGWLNIQVDGSSIIEIDTLNGIFYKTQESEINSEYRINYKHYNVKKLTKEDYEIWVKENQVKGIYIYPENISFEEKEDRLDSLNTERYYLFDGTYSEARVDNDSNRSFVLSNTNIIKGTLSVSDNLFEENFKEVEYIDGYTEFLNIEKMQKDFVPSLEKDELGQVQFSLQEIPYVDGIFSSEVKAYNKAGVAQEVTVNGRIATLTLSNEDLISKDYYVSYYYKTEETNYESYSVNYLDGILYTSKEIENNESVNVTYKIGRVGLEYFIYNEIENVNVDYDNSTIEIRTEEFFELNNNVKFLAFKNKDNLSLEGLENYFSPIIYSLKVGLN